MCKPTHGFLFYFKNIEFITNIFSCPNFRGRIIFLEVRGEGSTQTFLICKKVSQIVNSDSPTFQRLTFYDLQST